MERYCTNMMRTNKQNEDLHLTGNLSFEDVYSMVLAKFSTGKRLVVHLYDLGNNKDYQFKNKFKLDSMFYYLAARTTLIQAPHLRMKRKRRKV